MNLVGNGQNDVQEFILFLINSMHNCLSKKVNMTISGKVITEQDKKALAAFKSWKLFLPHKQGTCARRAKRPRVGRFPCRVFVFRFCFNLRLF